jgi:hypothetical protein
LANGRRDVIGVNTDRRESNLEIVADDVLALWRGSDNTVPSQSAALAAESERAKPYRLWWYAMVLVLAAAIAESLVAARYLATQREEP